MNHSSNTGTRKRRKNSQGRHDVLRAGQLVAITKAGAGWQAVVSASTVLSKTDPVVCSVTSLDTLGKYQRMKANRWIEHVERAESLPADLAKLRDRYVARAATAEGGRARDAKLVLELLERLAKAEVPAPTTAGLPGAANDNQ